MLSPVLLASPARGQDALHPFESTLVKAELVADVESIAPGATFRLGVRLKLADGWHVNWTNPGDAGLAPSIAWSLPEGFKAGILQWPLPSRFLTGPLAIFGYANEVLLMTDVRVPGDLAPGGNVRLGAGVSWLACEGECVPGSADIHLELPVEKSARPNTAHKREFDETEARLPGPAVTWSTSARMEGSNVVLEIQNGSATGNPLTDLFFFPYDAGLIENASPQTLSVSAGPGGQSLYQLRIEPARMPTGSLTQLHGVLVASSGLSSQPGPAAIEISVPVKR